MRIKQKTPRGKDLPRACLFASLMLSLFLDNFPLLTMFTRSKRLSMVSCKNIWQSGLKPRVSLARWPLHHRASHTPVDSWLFCPRTDLSATAPTRPPPLATCTLVFSFGLNAGEERIRMSRTILMANQILVLMEIFCHVTLALRRPAPVWRVWTMFMKLKWTSLLMVRKMRWWIFTFLKGWFCWRYFYMCRT